nr:CFF_HP1_G0040700.mRNA.1.CDS.1 [Saccharomyces cerevisiae]
MDTQLMLSNVIKERIECYRCYGAKRTNGRTTTTLPRICKWGEAGSGLDGIIRVEVGFEVVCGIFGEDNV